MTKCRYTSTYQDIQEEKKELHFTCDEEASDSGLCIFHDNSQYDKNKEVLKEALLKKIQLAYHERKALFLIGYNIPELYNLFEICNFPHEVYFTSAQFHGEVTFAKMLFVKGVSFYSATFNDKADFSYATFNDKADFSYATFKDEINFSNVNFKEDCYFISVKVGRAASFEDSVFAKTSTFDSAIFEGLVDYSNCILEGQSTFIEAKFSESVFFQRAQILVGINFDTAVFKSKIDLSMAKLGEVRFVSAEVGGKAFYDQSIFQRGIFDGASFGGEFNMTSANFEDNATFIGSRFTDNVYFDSTLFDSTTFDRAIFEVESSFSNVIFEGDTTFEDTKFNDNVIFERARFVKGAQFIGTVFNGQARSSEIVFEDYTSFRSSKFNAKAVFAWAKFADTNFDMSIFQEEVNFSDVQFDKTTSFVAVDFEGYLFFERTHFRQDVTFDTSIIKKQSNFYGAFFEGRANFIGVDFGDNTTFEKANFSLAQFNRSMFKGEATFSNAIFNDDTTFRSSKFLNTLYFKESEFIKSGDFTDCTFEDESDFSKCKFHGEGTFSYCNFTETSTTYFTNAFFNKSTFDNAQFGEIYFSDAIFNLKGEFSYTKFSNYGYFNGTEFLESAYFDRCSFGDKSVANFTDTIFQGELSFLSGRFNNQVFFVGSKFADVVFFNDCIFGAESVADFSNAIFYKESKFFNVTLGQIIFDDTVFNDKADFSYCKFAKKVSFDNTIFSENSETKFSYAIVSDELHYSGLIIESLTLFDHVKFDKESTVYFVDTTINANIDFSYSTFQNKCDFSRCKFNAKTDFSYSKFTQAYFMLGRFHDVSFRASEFIWVDFSETVIEFADFYQCSFRTAFFGNTKFNGPAQFKFAIFESGGKILFDVTDMSNVSFLNTDISNIRFGDDISWGENDRFTVSDERLLELEEKINVLFVWSQWTDKNVKEKIGHFLQKALNISWLDDYDLSWSKVQNEKIDLSSRNTRHIVSLILYPRDRGVLVQIDGIDSFSLPARPFDKDWIVYSKVSRVSAIVTIYRTLADNFENSLRHEEADNFYKKEMELRRRYKEVSSKSVLSVKANSRLNRTFSLTGLYCWLFTYGLDYKKPIILILLIVSIPILYSLWLLNPTLLPDFSNKGLSSVTNATTYSLSQTLNIKQEQVLGYLLGTITIPIVVLLLVAAVKRKFGRRYRK